MYSELHYALVFFLFGSMIATLKFDMRDKEHSYLYKAYRQHLETVKRFKSKVFKIINRFNMEQ